MESEIVIFRIQKRCTRVISNDTFLAIFLPIWQGFGNLDLSQNSLPDFFFGIYFRSASLASFF